MSEEPAVHGLVGRDGHTLSDFERGLYERAGLAPSESIEWYDAGIYPYAAETFRAGGFTLEEALTWKQAGLPAGEAVKARDLGLLPQEASERYQAKRAPEVARLAAERALLQAERAREAAHVEAERAREAAHVEAERAREIARLAEERVQLEAERTRARDEGDQPLDPSVPDDIVYVWAETYPGMAVIAKKTIVSLIATEHTVMEALDGTTWGEAFDILQAQEVSFRSYFEDEIVWALDEAYEALRGSGPEVRPADWRPPGEQRTPFCGDWEYEWSRIDDPENAEVPADIIERFGKVEERDFLSFELLEIPIIRNILHLRDYRLVKDEALILRAIG